MNIKKYYKIVEPFLSKIIEILTIIGVFVNVIVFILNLFNFDSSKIKNALITYIINNPNKIFLFTLTLIVIFLLIQFFKINSKLTTVFKDNFKEPLNRNWDIIGPWEITNDDYLHVTGSDQGGITKKGAYWENYIFSFEAKIINSCIGCVIRATDLNNYYMFQITNTNIRPHRRISYPSIVNTPDSTQIQINLTVGWHLFTETIVDHHKTLDDWFKVVVEVKGQSVNIYINDEIVFTKESFIQIPIGKVGFRNFGIEEGLIRKVRVKNI